MEQIRARFELGTREVFTGNPTIGAGKVAIVAATHKMCYPLDRCLASLRNLVADPADVVFVDNGSGGALSAWARDAFPDITVVTRSENGFFCGGYNAGLAYALKRDYDFALIVNADTEVSNPSFLGELLRAAERHPRGAFFGPKVFLREPGKVQNTVLTFPFFRRYLVDWAMDCVRKRRKPRSDEREKRVEYLNGVCVLCRMQSLREIGLMDEAMGGYVEDADWSWRARQMGWQSVYVPVPSIVHHQEEDGYEHFAMKMFLLRRNRVYWLLKCGFAVEARLYAAFALWLARLRCFRNRANPQVAENYRYYIARFQEVSRRLLSGEPLGEWFGPPLGPWLPPTHGKPQ